VGARQISKAIEASGSKGWTKTFLDEKDIETGDSISDSIKENIKACDEFLILLTRDSVNRQWVLLELGAAWILEKRISGIVYGISHEEMPQVLSLYKVIDLNKFDDEYLRELSNRVKKTAKRK
jgi:hypothetical protein